MAILPVSNIKLVGNGTSTGINTTGAALLVAGFSEEVTATGALSDSNTNAWVEIAGAEGSMPAGLPRTWVYYVKNPVVGSNHTFTMAGGNKTVLCVAAFSGTNTAANVDQSTATVQGAAATTVQPGSVTPTEDNELLVTYVGVGDATNYGVGTTFTIDGGYTITDQQPTVGGTNWAGALAYLIQTTAAASNPTWTESNSNRSIAGIATFKAAAAGAGKPYAIYAQQ